APKAILLAAGMGTRLGQLTQEVPKCLLPINGIPLLELWLGKLEQSPVEEVLINTHWLPDGVRKFLQDRKPSRLTIHECFEPSLLGSAGTLYLHRDWL